MWERNKRGRVGKGRRAHEDERGRLANFNELTAGVRAMGLQLQPTVCVFDLYIYDGSLPVCLLLPDLSDSIGDQQLDENTHFSHLELLCVQVSVFFLLQMQTSMF